MMISDLSGWLISTLLLSLRIAPVFALAPPFTLTRLPPLFRVLLGFGLAACLVSFHPGAAAVTSFAPGDLVVAAAREMLLGALVVAIFQMMFGALYVAGRTLDIQAGFGLSLLIDPTTKAQTPLAGMLFAYAAGAVFFALDGHAELLRILGASLETIPLGTAAPLPSVGRLAAFFSAVSIVAFGVAGGTILCLFLADLAIALLSRTAPQLNVLVLGFQLKTALFFIVLPTSFGLAGALFARLARITLEAVAVML